MSKSKNIACNLRVTSQQFFCPYALSMDLYGGCPHGCLYCFVRAQYVSNKHFAGKDLYSTIEKRDYKLVIDLLYGGRKPSEKDALPHHLLKAGQPLHIGGMADPFPYLVESESGHTLGFIKAIKEHPCIWSTKNPMPEYSDALGAGNHVLQLSLIGLSDRVMKIEVGLQEPLSRLQKAGAMRKNGSVKKLVVRMQPFIPHLYTQPGSIDKYLDALAENNVDAVTTEFLKKAVSDDWADLSGAIGVNLNTTFAKFPTQGTDKVLPLEYRRGIVQKLRDGAHARGIEFYSAENELRAMGDGPGCCGVSTKDPVFGSKMPWVANELLFEAKKTKGRIKLSDMVDRFPPDLIEKDSLLIVQNVGSRKNMVQYKEMTVRDLLAHKWSTKNYLNPSMFFDNLVPVETPGGIEYQYVEK